MNSSTFDPANLVREVHGCIAEAKRRAADRPHLVAYDANGIQAFVTASAALPYMRGASSTIRDFDERQRSDPGTLFAGGGRGLFLVSETDAARLSEMLPDEFADATHGGSLAVTAVPLTHDETGSLGWLRQKLAAAKDAARPPASPIFGQRSADRCQDCRARPVRTEVSRGSNSVLVCERCSAMICAGRDDARQARERGNTLQDLSLTNRVVTISADGNEMGLLFGQLASLRDQAIVSRAVSALFENALQGAFDDARIADQEHVAPVTGGDDIRVFTGPERMFELISSLVHRLECDADDWSKRLDLPVETVETFQRIGIGMGVVIGHDHYPARRLIEYAHDLERAAKKICGSDAHRSAVCFLHMRSGDELTAGGDRGHCIGMTRHDRSPGEWSALVHRARALANVPGSQRAQLRRELVRGDSDEVERKNWFRYQVARSRTWRDYLAACNADWTVPEQVDVHVPDARLLELAGLAQLSHKEGGRA